VALLALAVPGRGAPLDGVTGALPSVPSLPPTPSLKPPASLPTAPSLPSTPPSAVPRRLPAAPPPGSGGLPSLGGGGGSSRSAPARPAGAGGSGGPSSASGLRSSTQGGGAAGGEKGSASGRGAQGITASGGSARTRRARHERRLRRAVEQLQGCLSAVSTPARRVLVLRTGIGSGPPRSRGYVANRLGLSRARVARIERVALGDLRAADRQTGCSAGSLTYAVSVGAKVPSLVSASYVSSAPALVDTPELADGGEVLGATKSSDDAPDPATDESAAGLGLLAVDSDSSESFGPTLLLLLLGLALLAGTAIVAARRQLLTAFVRSPDARENDPKPFVTYPSRPPAEAADAEPSAPDSEGTDDAEGQIATGAEAGTSEPSPRTAEPAAGRPPASPPWEFEGVGEGDDRGLSAQRVAAAVAIAASAVASLALRKLLSGKKPGSGRSRRR
jgi:hypothetical protein